MNNNGNRMINGQYQKYNINNNYQNNQLLSNNPNFINNTMFQQKINMVKMEHLSQNKNINLNNIDKNKLTEYVICPIKINKCDKNEINNNLKNLEKGYSKNNNELVKLWNNRTNIPYKGIIKNDDYKKKIKSTNDLIVHKVTNEDKIGLLKQYKELELVLKNHNNQLSIIYNKSKELDHKKKFKYNNSYKFRLKHDPQNFNKIKELHKNEQNKIEKEQTKIDNLISSLIDNDILNNDEKKNIMEDINKYQENINNFNNKIKEELDIDEKTNEEIDKEIDKEIDLEIQKLQKDIESENNIKNKIKIKCNNKEVSDEISDASINKSLLDKYKKRSKK